MSAHNSTTEQLNHTTSAICRQAVPQKYSGKHRMYLLTFLNKHVLRRQARMLSPYSTCYCSALENEFVKSKHCYVVVAKTRVSGEGARFLRRTIVFPYLLSLQCDSLIIRRKLSFLQVSHLRCNEC